jgi:hypothetical protein
MALKVQYQEGLLVDDDLHLLGDDLLPSTNTAQGITRQGRAS